MKSLAIIPWKPPARRVIVGIHGQSPDCNRGIDRLVDNRAAFRQRLQTLHEWKSNEWRK